MGQGCSSDSYGDFDGCDRRIFAESPDPIMRELMKASVAATEGLRDRALRERFGSSYQHSMNEGGGSNGDSDSDSDDPPVKPESAPPSLAAEAQPEKHHPSNQKPPPRRSNRFRKDQIKVVEMARGQDHLLFQNLAVSASAPNASRKTPPKGKGRKIAESFGTASELRHPGPHQQAPLQQQQQQQQQKSGSNTSGSATGPSQKLPEDFEVALSRQLAAECPTRLWLRRQPRSRRRRKTSSSSRPRSGPMLKMLEDGADYRPSRDYFGSDAAKAAAAAANRDPVAHETARDHDGPPPVVVFDPRYSTNIYAFRSGRKKRGGSTTAGGGGDNNNNGRPEQQHPPPLETTTTTTTTTREQGALVAAAAMKSPSPSAVPPSPRIPAATSSKSSDDGINSTSKHSDPAASKTTTSTTNPPTGGMFGPAQMAPKPKRDVLGWTTISEEHSIYVVDIGLTPSMCDAVVTTTEQACEGQYAAYTYAKQTLGCREYPELAEASLGPVHSMVRAVYDKFGHKYVDPGGGVAAPSPTLDPANQAGSGGVGAAETTTTTDENKSDAKGSVNRKESIAEVLQLDAREPHIVKYDVTKKERQKLDMHTDKSEWTFLIALSNGCGMDYEGGGTYFECLDATVHVQKGHALVFPGKLRHRGQAIHHGLRFLLVGFLIDKREDHAAKAAICDAANKALRKRSAADPANGMPMTPQGVPATTGDDTPFAEKKKNNHHHHHLLSRAAAFPTVAAA